MVACSEFVFKRNTEDLPEPRPLQLPTTAKWSASLNSIRTTDTGQRQHKKSRTLKRHKLPKTKQQRMPMTGDGEQAKELFLSGVLEQKQHLKLVLGRNFERTPPESDPEPMVGGIYIHELHPESRQGDMHQMPMSGWLITDWLPSRGQISEPESFFEI